jgi:hypothetical protein
VLPFTNMSGDPEQAYFADGMNEGSVRSRASGPQHGPAGGAGTGQKPD